jgi:hypothetical protein
VTEQQLMVIEEEIEAIQIGYDLVGYLSTNSADELITYARQLIKAQKQTIEARDQNIGINHLFNHENMKPPYMDLDDE